MYRKTGIYVILSFYYCLQGINFGYHSNSGIITNHVDQLVQGCYSLIKYLKPKSSLCNYVEQREKDVLLLIVVLSG